eukprot:5861338-Prorocentrum_lima.AAC.1
MQKSRWQEAVVEWCMQGAMQMGVRRRERQLKGRQSREGREEVMTQQQERELLVWQRGMART